MTYILDKGFISRGAHVSYESPEEFETLEEAKKEASLIALLPNEYIDIYDQEGNSYYYGVSVSMQ